MRRQHQAHAEHPILLTALHDITSLDEHLLVAGVLDLHLVDLADLAHLDDLLRQRLLQCQRHGSAAGFAMHEIDREVAVHRRVGQAISIDILGFGVGSAVQQAEPE